MIYPVYKFQLSPELMSPVISAPVGKHIGYNLTTFRVESLVSDQSNTVADQTTTMSDQSDTVVVFASFAQYKKVKEQDARIKI